MDINGKKFYPYKEVLVFDIETKRKDINKPISPENSELKIWGAYSYKYDKLYFGYNNNIQELFNDHRILIGHNIKGFDLPVLQQEGVHYKENLIVDLLEVLRKPPSRSEKEAFRKKGKKAPTGKGRANIIGEARIKGMEDLRFPDFKLSTIAKHLYKLFHDNPTYSQYLTNFKDEEFDYNILQKDIITVEDWIYIKNYLKQDILTTKGIFEWMEAYFEPLMAHELPDEDVINLEYVFAPTGSYAYKCLCKAIGAKEEYGDAKQVKFLGAKVLLPEKESYGPEDGDGYCLDFNSQHPSHQRCMNLYTPINKCKHKINGNCPHPWSGEPVFHLKGIYCGCEQGKIEQVLKRWFVERKEMKKKGDPREYGRKICLNASYGISSSPIFKSIYTPTTGPDTTLMSRNSLEFMANWMTKGGYKVVYGDTDSLYLFDPFKNKKQMIEWNEKGIDEIKKCLPFPDEYYKMGVDAEFTHIYFFREAEIEEVMGKRGVMKRREGENELSTEDLYKKRLKDLEDKYKFKKKNYIYLTKEDEKSRPKVKMLGLPLLKSNSPKLAKLIYSKYLEKEILRKKSIKFSKEWINQLLEYEITEGSGVEILATKINCKPAASYAKESQLQAALSKKYLKGKDGQIEVIKHLRKEYGVGKGTFYCTKEEAKKLHYSELDLETVWTTLNPFITKQKQQTLDSFTK